MKKLFFICLSTVLILCCFCGCAKQVDPEKDKAAAESGLHQVVQTAQKSRSMVK